MKLILFILIRDRDSQLHHVLYEYFYFTYLVKLQYTYLIIILQILYLDNLFFFLLLLFIRDNIIGSLES